MEDCKSEDYEDYEQFSIHYRQKLILIKNYNEVSSHTSENGLHQKVWREYEEKGILLHCRREYKCWCSHSGKRYGDSLKHKIELPYDPEIPLLGILQKGRKLVIRKAMCTRGAQALKALGSPSFKTEEKAQENRHINGPGASSLSEAGSWRTPHCAQQAPDGRRRQSPLPGRGRLHRFGGSWQRVEVISYLGTSSGRAPHPLCDENDLQPGSGASWRKVSAVNGLSAKLPLPLPSRFSRVRLCVTP